MSPAESAVMKARMSTPLSLPLARGEDRHLDNDRNAAVKTPSCSFARCQRGGKAGAQIAQKIDAPLFQHRGKAGEVGRGMSQALHSLGRNAIDKDRHRLHARRDLAYLREALDAQHVIEFWVMLSDQIGRSHRGRSAQ